MIPDWRTTHVYFSSLLAESFPNFWDGLERILARHRVEVGLLRETNDVWAQDYMAIQVDETTFVKFTYRPDYLRGYEHLITGEDVCQQFAFLEGPQNSDIRLDGGNVVASSRCVILTEKVFRENPSWPRKKLREELRRLLRVEECIFIPVEWGDLIGHADGVVRFLDDDRVVINDYSELDPDYGDELVRILRRHRLHVEVLPYAVDDEPRRGEIGSAVGNRVNFLRVGNLVVMPVYGIPQDDEALRKMEGFLPGADVVPLPSSELAREGGVVNCVSWTIRGVVPELGNSDEDGSSD